MNDLKPIMEEIKNRLDITTAFLNAGYSLTSAGTNKKKCSCPFHSEKTPSMMIFEDSQSYYCFGCGESGDVITFYMKTNLLPFKEAVIELAKELGIEVDDLDMGAIKEQQRGMQILELANNFFKKQYERLPSDSEFKKNIRNRGLDDSKDWYGYAPPDIMNKLINPLLEKGFTKDEITKVGLLNDRGNCYFYNRLMFTINNYMGKNIAFSGRILGDGVPKYVNSPNTEYFDKSKNMFNIDRAKKSIKEKNEVYIVEGQFDVIAMYDNGYTNTVASSGTSFTEQQMKELLMMLDNGKIIFLLDGDKAGIKALQRIFKNYPEIHKYAYVIILPDGKDPCEYLKDNKELPEDEFMIEWIYSNLEKKVVQASLPDRARFSLQAYKSFIPLIKDSVLKRQYEYKIETWAGEKPPVDKKKKTTNGVKVRKKTIMEQILSLIYYNRSILERSFSFEDFPLKYQVVVRDFFNNDLGKYEKQVKALDKEPCSIVDEEQIVSQFRYLIKMLKKQTKGAV